MIDIWICITVHKNENLAYNGKETSEWRKRKWQKI